MAIYRGGAGTIIGAVICGMVMVSSVEGANWPRFRGPNGQGLSEATSIPTTWSQQDYNWKIALAGTGHSSPVVWDQKVFVTCVDEVSIEGIVQCVNGVDGTELWRRSWPLTKSRINALNSLASATPAVDAEYVYVLWPGTDKTVLVALTHQGEQAWTVSLAGVRARHGYGSSPIMHGRHVIVSLEKEVKGEGVESEWLAVDRSSGEVAWRHSEEPVENVSYSTPCVYRDEQGREHLVFVSNAHGVAGVDPRTGDLLWESASVLPARVVASPVIAGKLIVATCGQGGGGVRLAAVKPGYDGTSYSATEVYGLKGKHVSYAPTAVGFSGLLFTFHDSGLISCLEQETGRVLWSEKPAGRFYGSPVCVSGVLYAMTTKGEVVVVKAAATYTLFGVNPLGQDSQATPAVADGRMYLRTHSQLISIGGKEH